MAHSFSRRSIGAMETKAPLLVLANVELFLDAHGLGSGPITATRIGDGGGSNFTFLLERGDERLLLRPPPRPPLPPPAPDMGREARLQNPIPPAGFDPPARTAPRGAAETVIAARVYV